MAWRVLFFAKHRVFGKEATDTHGECFDENEHDAGYDDRGAWRAGDCHTREKADGRNEAVLDAEDEVAEEVGGPTRGCRHTTSVTSLGND